MELKLSIIESVKNIYLSLTLSLEMGKNAGKWQSFCAAPHTATDLYTSWSTLFSTYYRYTLDFKILFKFFNCILVDKMSVVSSTKKVESLTHFSTIQNVEYKFYLRIGDLEQMHENHGMNRWYLLFIKFKRIIPTLCIT